MLDLATYRARIGSAPGLMNKILSRKTLLLEQCGTDRTKDDDFHDNLVLVVLTTMKGPVMAVLTMLFLLAFFNGEDKPGTVQT